MIIYSCASPYARKFYKVMKLTVFFITLFCLHVSANVYSQVNIKGRNLPLTQVISTLQQQTGYSFLCNQQLIADIKVSPNLNNATLKQALDELLKDEPLSYEIVDKIVVIKEKKKNLFDQIKEALTPPTTVTGKVVDETGQPLASVTVKIKSSGVATATDKNGAFEITVPGDQETLVFSFIGYETQEFGVKYITKGAIISMKAVPTNLQEVVVNKGPYSVRQELNTGNVSHVEGATIAEQPVSDPILALIGQVPSLNIQQTSGIPGAYSAIRIRGQSSIFNGNDPLYIIDGVPFSSISLSQSKAQGIGPVGLGTLDNGSAGGNKGSGLSPFNVLNPSDIASIDILKDADATAIYGSRGANGVILITTKKGVAGNTRFDMNLSTGAGSVGHQVDLLNTQQYLALRHQALHNDNKNPGTTDYDLNGAWDTTRYTNLQKELIGGTANFSNFQGNISGGDANTQFLAGVGYSRQTTVYPGDYADQKLMAHFNLTHTSTDKRFTMQFVTSYSNDNNRLPSVDFTNYIAYAPDLPPAYDANGRPNWQVYNGTSTNSNNYAAFILRKSTSITNNLISNLSLSYQLLPGLTLKGTFGYTRAEMNQSGLIPGASVAPPNLNAAASRQNTFATTTFSSWIAEPQLSYQKMVGPGKLDVLLGTSFQENNNQSIVQVASGFVSDALITDPKSASSVTLAGTTAIQYKYNALYGRIGYNISDKYILNLTARRDGSSRFGPGNQFGNFGAVGGAWLFSKEKFIQDHLPFLSFGKLRASYGTSGNDQIVDYQFLSTYASVSGSYQGATGLSPVRLANPNFAWEVVKKAEIGMDIGVLKDKILLSLAYFRDRTGNQLVGYPLTIVAGFNSVQYNLPAVVQNTGLEISLNTANIQSKNFQWTSGLNFTIPQNKLVAYPGLASSSYANTYIIGQSIFTKRLYQVTGVNPQTGLYTFSTANANGIPSNPQNLVTTVVPTQHYYGGLQNRFAYKRISLDIFLQYVNQTALNWKSVFGYPGQINYNQPTAIFNSIWNSAGDLASTQRSTTTSTNKQAFNSSNGVYDNSASFLRVKNVALSYQLADAWVQKMHLRNARLYVQAQNLFTITNYIGLDPETAGGLSLPPLRMISAGLQVGL